MRTGLPRVIRAFSRALFCDITNSNFLQQIFGWFNSIMLEGSSHVSIQLSTQFFTYSFRIVTNATISTTSTKRLRALLKPKATEAGDQYKFLNAVLDGCSFLIDYHGVNHFNIFVNNIRFVSIDTPLVHTWIHTYHILSINE